MDYALLLSIFFLSLQIQINLFLNKKVAQGSLLVDISLLKVQCLLKYFIRCACEFLHYLLPKEFYDL